MFLQESHVELLLIDRETPKRIHRLHRHVCPGLERLLQGGNLGGPATQVDLRKVGVASRGQEEVQRVA